VVNGSKVVGSVPLRFHTVGQRTITLGSLSTYVVCIDMGLDDSDAPVSPDLEDAEDVEMVAYDVNLPGQQIDTPGLQCRTPISALSAAILYGKVVLRSTRPDHKVVDAMDVMPPLNPIAGDKVSCNGAWIRKPAVRSNSPDFDHQEWVHITGSNCAPERPTDLESTAAFDKYYVYSFGARRSATPMNSCVVRTGVDWDEYSSKHVSHAQDPARGPPSLPPAHDSEGDWGRRLCWTTPEPLAVITHSELSSESLPVYR